MQIRANGRAELVGDILITCRNITESGTANVTVSFPTVVTSRATGTPAASEALLLVNEPGSGISGAPLTQIPCDTASAIAAACPADANVIQGAATGPYEVTFYSVPVGVTGPDLEWVLRITNLRIDVSNGLVGNIAASVNTSDTGLLPLTNPWPAVAVVQPGSVLTSQLLLPDASGALPAEGIAVNGCFPVNQPLALNPASSDAPDGVSFVLRLNELFASAFKTYVPVGSYYAPDADTRPALLPQAKPGTIWNDESGFYNPAFPSGSRLNTAGLATQGTRFLVRFQSPARGVQVIAPVYERGKGVADSRVRLIAAAADGSSADYTPLGPLSSLNTYYTSDMTYTYEATDIQNALAYYANDTVDLPFYLAYAGPGPLPASGATTVNVSLAPISNDGTAAGTWVPRFLDTSVPLPVADLAACRRPVLKANILTHSGPASARTWPIEISNNGAVDASKVQITGLSVTQTSGPACGPKMLSAFPLNLGSIAAGGSATASALVDFSDCAAASRFTAVVSYSADGDISGTTVFKNQLR